MWMETFLLENVSEDILIVSYIGFEEQEVAIKGRKYVKVILKENSQLLDEVVVVGYGAQKKGESDWSSGES